VEKVDVDLGASREGSRTGIYLMFNVYFRNSLNVLGLLGLFVSQSATSCQICSGL
jgi:hypothetical protein